ncbi:hypothetical protein Btru_032357 [Bulinus truncatus]|nr:hypothetical protein Btru_032357 [Bulinus truncatus]
MPRHGVNYVKNEDPSFIKQLKERVGHTEGPTVDTKRNLNESDDDGDDDDIPEKEDEKPVIVVLREGDLSAEEVAKEQNLIDEGPARLSEKITFKKPSKRSQETSDSTTESSSGKKSKDSKPKKESTAKKTKNNSLLSFEEEDDDE